MHAHVVNKLVLVVVVVVIVVWFLGVLWCLLLFGVVGLLL